VPIVKLLILGATGGTGREIVTQALAAGHEVTTLVRDRSRMRLDDPHLTVVDTGDVAAEGPALTRAMRGQDAVISALGRGKTFASDDLMRRSVPRIIQAMQATDVRRLIFTSALGVGDSFTDSPLLPKLFFVTLLRNIYADKLAGDRLIRSSGLQWTIVQPAQLTEGPLTKVYRSGEHLELTGMPAISRADTAHFIVNCLGDPSTIGRTIILAS
jgi:putative NADH-flavin reductase